MGPVLCVANVGDSRLYIIGEEEIRQITRDHSLVEELVERGEMERGSAENLLRGTEKYYYPCHRGKKRRKR